MQKPNIILITWHDLGDWLGCYGREDVVSPNLDRLATQGMIFDSYFSTAPQCSPSRASMVTGLMPHATGVLGLTHRGFDMDRDQIPLAGRVRQAGYSTHLIGLQHECRDPQWEGYDEIYADRLDAESVATETIQFLARKHNTTNAAPFFLAVGTKDVHRPHGEEYDPEQLSKIQLPPYLPDREVAYRDMAVFYQRIEQADRQMGRIFQALAQNDLEDSTVVIFTTDHGAAIPRAKQTLYDSGLKITLVMRWPGQIPAGTRCDALLSNVDLTPTILELAGAEIPGHLHGRSFQECLDGGPCQIRNEVFAELTWHCHYRPMRAIRTEEYKYIINFVAGIPMLLEDGAISRYGVRILEEEYGRPLPEEELYYLRTDPHELDNCAGKSEYEDVREGLRRRLLDRLHEIDDPILKGPISNPEPARTKAEFWYPDGECYRLHIDGEWTQSAP